MNEEKIEDEVEKKIKALEPLPIVRVLFLFLLKKFPESSGYFISKQVTQIFGGRIILRSGTVYNELRKMEKMGLVSSIREKSKRRIRKYVLTEKGEKELNKLKNIIKERVEYVLLPLISFIDGKEYPE